MGHYLQGFCASFRHGRTKRRTRRGPGFSVTGRHRLTACPPGRANCRFTVTPGGRRYDPLIRRPAVERNLSVACNLSTASAPDTGIIADVIDVDISDVCCHCVGRGNNETATPRTLLVLLPSMLRGRCENFVAHFAGSVGPVGRCFQSQWQCP